MDDEYTDPDELRRAELLRRQQLILWLLAPALVWGVIRYGAKTKLVTGSFGTVLDAVELVIGLTWAGALFITSAQLSKLPHVKPDELERAENLQRLADGFVSTIVLITVVTFVSVFVDFSATAFGFLFFAVALVSLRFPIARIPGE